MSEIERLLEAYRALDRLPNYTKQAVQAGSVMAKIASILRSNGVEVES